MSYWGQEECSICSSDIDLELPIDITQEQYEDRVWEFNGWISKFDGNEHIVLCPDCQKKLKGKNNADIITSG